MIYQNILTELSPYRLWVNRMGAFGEHRHGDIEIHFCLSGDLSILINKKTYLLQEGELILISPMVSHSFPKSDDPNQKIMTMIVGVSFLKKYFSYFSQAKRECYVIPKDADSELHQKLRALLFECAELYQPKGDRNELLLRGNLYKICSYLIDLTADTDTSSWGKNREITKVANIERALEMIYYDYAMPLTVADAADATGYGKSNFCKIFKSITGDTFHNVLNRQRVESACSLLTQSDLPISEIALRVGFGEAKTLCRVFKAVMGKTPGEYRKKR